MCLSSNNNLGRRFGADKMHLRPSTVAKATVRTKAVFLLFLIFYLMYFRLFVGSLCLSLFWYALLCVRSSFAIFLKRKRESWLIAFIVSLVFREKNKN